MDQHPPHQDRPYWIMGSTHIDLAWKKNHAEMAELEEIFILRLLDLLEQNPDFKYVIEQAAHLRHLSESRPDLIRRLKPFLADGRVEVVGGMASTMETNVPNGECFIRNQKIGLEWIRDHLGVEVQTAWLIDTFGIHAQIPQILNQFGFRHLMANRFGGTLHDSIFIDRGLDGSEILVVGRDVYSASVNPKDYLFQFVGNWEQVDSLFQQAQLIEGSGPYVIMPYTENEVLPMSRLIHWVEQGNKAQTGQPWRFIQPRDYFAYLDTSKKTFPVIHGDLNPEFTGTFSQRMQIRLCNRRVENLLLEAEKWAALSRTHQEVALLKESWWDLAFIHFHDVFTGSHPTEVFVDVMERFERIEQTASIQLRRAAGSASGVLASHSTGLRAAALNGLPWKRNDLIEVALPSDSGVSAVKVNGTAVPFTCFEGQLNLLAELQPTSQNLIEITPGSLPNQTLQPCPFAVIENESLRLECDQVNGIHELLLKPGKQVILKDAGDFLVLQQDEGSFQIESPHSAEIPAAAGTMELYQPLQTAVGQQIILKGVFPEFKWSPPGSRLSWQMDFLLPHGREELRLTLRLHWKGEASRIRLKFATQLAAAEAIYEIPFGTIRRKPYGTRATARGEWPAQRFVAVQNQQAGLALINTGVPGVETANGTLWTTLLRAPKSEYAGMVSDESSSQHGDHLFKFALLPFLGSWSEAGTARLGQEMNNPVFTTLLGEGENLPEQASSFLSLEPEQVVLSSVKLSEDESGDLVLRLYETTGQAAHAQLYIKDSQQAWVSDVWEQRIRPIRCSENRVELDLQPFEIITLLVHRDPPSREAKSISSFKKE